MNKKILYALITIAVILTASLIFLLLKNDVKQWEGEWEMRDYLPDSASGTLRIKNCYKNSCNFMVGASHGGHTCDVEGKFKIIDNIAVYKEIVDDFYPSEPIKEMIIIFSLNKKKRQITIHYTPNAHLHCAISGYFDGIYDHVDNPLRYPTSFNCWKKDATLAEKTICESEELSRADLELYKNYPISQTPEFIKARDNCKQDENCLQELYVNTIKKEYEKKEKHSFDFYDYLKKHQEDLDSFENLAVLNDYLQKNMEQHDYGRFSYTMIERYDLKCENCTAISYSVSGLYGIMDALIYFDQSELWLAYLDPETDGVQHIIYAPVGKTKEDMPEKVRLWLEYRQEDDTNTYFKTFEQNFSSNAPIKWK